MKHLKEEGNSQDIFFQSQNRGSGVMAPSAHVTSEEVGLQYPAPKTKFSREITGCSGPVSGPPFPNQEPLPGRVKLERRGRGKQEVSKLSSAPRGAATEEPVV